MSVKIRKMKEADALRISELEAICFSQPWSVSSLLDTWKTGQSLFLVAEMEGELCGYVGMTYAADEGEITNIAVFPEYRRQGVGEALLGALQRAAAGLSLTVIFLDVRLSNTSALALYQKMGFEEVGIRKRFYTDPEEDAYVMRRNLPSEIGILS